MTFEEAARLDPDEQPGEIVDGVWVPVTNSTWRHGAIIGSITFLLKLYARQNPGWSVAAADPGVKLGRNPDRLRAPDVAMVREARVPTGKGVEGWLEGAPDVVVEVSGDSQSFSELLKKALEYLGAGAQMVWLVDADPQRVVICTSPNQFKILNPNDTLDGGETLPGFSCKVSDLFTT